MKVSVIFGFFMLFVIFAMVSSKTDSHSQPKVKLTEEQKLWKKIEKEEAAEEEEAEGKINLPKNEKNKNTTTETNTNANNQTDPDSKKRYFLGNVKCKEGFVKIRDTCADGKSNCGSDCKCGNNCDCSKGGKQCCPDKEKK